MKNNKQIIAMVLVLFLVLTTSIPSFAAGNIKNIETSTIVATTDNEQDEATISTMVIIAPPLSNSLLRRASCFELAHGTLTYMGDPGIVGPYQLLLEVEIFSRHVVDSMGASIILERIDNDGFSEQVATYQFSDTNVDYLKKAQMVPVYKKGIYQIFMYVWTKHAADGGGTQGGSGTSGFVVI